VRSEKRKVVSAAAQPQRVGGLPPESPARDMIVSCGGGGPRPSSGAHLQGSLPESKSTGSGSGLCKLEFNRSVRVRCKTVTQKAERAILAVEEVEMNEPL
jgi:hypothetical protein